MLAATQLGHACVDERVQRRSVVLPRSAGLDADLWDPLVSGAASEVAARVAVGVDFDGQAMGQTGGAGATSIAEIATESAQRRRTVVLDDEGEPIAKTPGRATDSECEAHAESVRYKRPGLCPGRTGDVVLVLAGEAKGSIRKVRSGPD